MTYLAPRQGRFAIIVLLSLCLHILFFMVNSNQALQNRHEQAATLLSERLADEIRLPLAIDDKVGLAMIAKRYETDPAVSYIAIYNAQNTLLVPVGQDIDDNGIQSTIQDGDSVLGRLVVKTVPISPATLFVQHWLFLLATLMIHAMLWMVYGYVARPSNQMIEEIRQDVRASTLNYQWSPYDEPAHHAATGTTSGFSQHAQATTAHANTHTQTTQKATTDTADGTTASADNTNDTADHRHHNSERLLIQVGFIDDDKLLAVLAHEMAAAYFRLCDQLLEHSLAVLQTHPDFADIAIDGVGNFDAQGVRFYLVKTKEHAKLAMAAAWVVKLLPFVYQVIYQTHQQHRQFALPIKVIASNEHYKNLARTILYKYNHPSSVVLANDDLQQINTHVQLSSLANGEPNERQCHVINLVNKEFSDQLVQLRKTILTNASMTRHTTNQTPS